MLNHKPRPPERKRERERESNVCLLGRRWRKRGRKWERERERERALKDFMGKLEREREKADEREREKERESVKQVSRNPDRKCVSSAESGKWPFPSISKAGSPVEWNLRKSWSKNFFKKSFRKISLNSVSKISVRDWIWIFSFVTKNDLKKKTFFGQRRRNKKTSEP